jgi:hypothetical protein
MHINHGLLNAAMPKKFLQCGKIICFFQEDGGKGMPCRVKRDLLVDTHALGYPLEHSVGNRIGIAFEHSAADPMPGGILNYSPHGLGYGNGNHFVVGTLGFYWIDNDKIALYLLGIEVLHIAKAHAREHSKQEVLQYPMKVVGKLLLSVCID